jgi:mono/diheme cytochrome c family protein
VTLPPLRPRLFLLLRPRSDPFFPRTSAPTNPMKIPTLLPFCALLAVAVSAQAQAPASAPSPEQMELGKQVYMTCMPCHQPTGMGLPMVFPPLVKTEYVLGPADRLVAMILKGNAGPMTVDGKPYNNIMPPQEATLDDAKVAAVATYVRNSFGNSASAVPTELATEVRKKFADRKTPWTEAELKAWPGAGAAPAPAQ